MKRKRMYAFLTLLLLLLSVPVPAASLSRKEVALYVHDSFTLQADGFLGSVTWKSSDKTIATVSKNGKVKAKKEGTVIITARSGKQKKSCTVTVKPITLSKTKKTVLKGKPFSLKLYCGATKGIRWKSSNQSVVKIKEKAGNKVTLQGVKKGKAIITATYKGKNYECVVKVKKAVHHPAVPSPTPTPVPTPTQSPDTSQHSDVTLPEIRI